MGATTKEKVVARSTNCLRLAANSQIKTMRQLKPPPLILCIVFVGFHYGGTEALSFHP